MVECAEFLNSIGQLYDAFSIHCKGATYSVKSADEALSLVRQCKKLLDRNTNEIRMQTGITTTIYRPQGHVSAKTIASVALVEWGLQTLRLYTNLEPFNYSATNLLSSMTLDVENCHSTVHIKQVNISMMEYCRSFGLTMKESVKRVTHWAAHYHTSRKSWYPKPEETIPFSKVPLIKATSRRRHVETKLRHYAGLAFGLWSCSTTSNSAPRDDDGKAWYSTRVHLSAAMHPIRPQSWTKVLTHLSKTNAFYPRPCVNSKTFFLPIA